MGKRISTDEARQMVTLYEAGASTHAIGEEMGRPFQSVQKILVRAGVEMRSKGGKPRRVLTEEEREHIRANYPGKTIPEIAGELRCSGTLVSETLRELGIATRRSGWQPKLSEEKRAAILALWLDGKSTNAIREELDAGAETVKRVVDVAGLEWAVRQRRGEDSPMWRGGKVALSGGYVGVWVDHDDPMRVMAQGRDGYVAEHRLVMARSIGRPLERHETVHHLNGERNDNRLENLQLRIGRHGKGVVMRCLDCGSHNIEAQKIGKAS